jgi:hypothetical protein
MPHDDSRTFSIKVPEDGYNVINYIVLPVTTIVPTSSAVAGNAKLGTTTTTISGSNVIVGYYESD